MRISGLGIRYLHPLLSPVTTDYSSGNLDFGFDIEHLGDTGEIRIKTVMDPENPFIRSRIDSGNFLLGCYIICEDTMYNQFHQCGVGEDEIRIKVSNLNGRVIIRPAGIVNQHFRTTRHDSVNIEFGEELGFRKSTLALLADDQVFFVEPEKLQPFGAVFELAQKDGLEDGQFSVDTESDRIIIFANRYTYEHVSLMRNTKEKRDQLISSVYLPALMETLDIMSKDNAHLEGKNWYEVISEKCTDLDMVPGQGGKTSLEIAQKILAFPLHRILTEDGEA